MEVAEAEVAEVAFAVAAVVPAVAGEALAQGEEEVDSEEGAEASEAGVEAGAGSEEGAEAGAVGGGEDTPHTPQVACFAWVCSILYSYVLAPRQRPLVIYALTLKDASRAAESPPTTMRED